MKTMLALALIVSQSLGQSVYTPYTFITLAGNAGYGSADGTASDARFNYPQGVTVDSAGNAYVADTFSHTIRKITPGGAVTTLAGSAGLSGSTDGAASTARFGGTGVTGPCSAAVDSVGNVYVADTENHTIRKVTPGGEVTTLAGSAGRSGSADGRGSSARFYYPSGVTVDGADNIYVADKLNNTIRKVTAAGVVTTLAGQAGRYGRTDGTGDVARFDWPSGVAVDSAGNIYVAEQLNSTIRRVTAAGVVTTLAGLAGSSGSADGIGNSARFSRPSAVAVDSAGNVYVADTQNHTIRKMTPTRVVTTLAGLLQFNTNGIPMGGSADGTGSDARFSGPAGVSADDAGNIYVADTGNHTIRKVTAAGVVTTVAGLAGGAGSVDATGSAAHFYGPAGTAVDSRSNVYVADTGNHTIRKVTPTGVVTTLAGQPGSFGSADGTGSDARFYFPSGVAVDSSGNIYVADNVNHTIRKVTPEGVVTTLAGRFNFPDGVAVDSTGNVYVADTYNYTIRKVTPGGVVTTLAGLAGSHGFADGTGSAARFDTPTGVAVDSAGNVYVADLSNQAIRKVTPSGVVTTLAGLPPFYGSADGTGSDARFFYPFGVAVDIVGNVYVTDANNETIRKVTPSGVVTTLAGLAVHRGNADGTGSSARFNYPYGLAVDSGGNIYLADYLNNTIRKGYPALAITSPGANLGFSGGQFGFNLTGPSEQFVVVEGSTDLVRWLPLWTNTFAFPAALNLIDPESGTSSHRFYRARTP